jgi:hypothetical protein
MEKKKITLSDKLVPLLILLCCLIFFLPYRIHNETIEDMSKSDTVWKYKTDTVYDTLTFEKETLKLKAVDTLKKDKVISCKGDTFELVTEKKKYLDTLYCKGDTAIINASVTGINTSLDSLSIILRKRNFVQTNTIEITNTVVKRKRFHISPQLGIGYGILNNKCDIYIGIGIGYDL